ncbi:MAG: PKD domain-containing protein [Paludibacter sp.]
MKQFLKNFLFTSILICLNLGVAFSGNETIPAQSDTNIYQRLSGSGPDASFKTTADTSTVNGQNILTVCSTSTTKDVSFTNTSATESTNTNYTIDWGDNSPRFDSIGWKKKLVHTYSLGVWTLVYTVNGPNGTSTTKTYSVYVGSNPKVGFQSPGNTDNCINLPLTFPISGTENNPPGTKYTITFNDGTPSQVFTHPAPSEITHTFSKTSCGVTSFNGNTPYPNSFSASILASNSCGETGVSVVPIYISTSPLVDFNMAKTTSPVNSSVDITNTTTGYVNQGANCSIVPKIVWSITPATGFTLKSGTLGNDYGSDESGNWDNGTDIISPIFNTPGTYTIKLRVDTKRCGNGVIEKTICVEAPLVPKFTMDTNTGCTPVVVNAVNQTDISKSCTNNKSWTVNYTADNCGISPANWNYINGTNQLSDNPSFSFVTPGIYKIKLTASNTAGAYSTEQTVVVKKPPTVSIDAIPDYCGTASFTPKAVVNGCDTENGILSFTWSFPGGNPSSSDKQDPGIINYNTTGTYKATLTITNGCGSVTANSNDFSVNALPFVNDIGSQLINNQQQTNPIVFSGSNQTVYHWTNDNTKIGLLASGTGNIAAFTVQNSGKSVIKANITVTPQNSVTGCIGTAKTFSITVNPSGDLNQPNNQIVSNGVNTTAVVFTSGNTGGTTTFNWTNDTPEIGLANSGTGDIDSFKALNETNAPKIATITVTPVFDNGGIISVGASKSFTITVIPTAKMNQPSDIELCNGGTTQDVIFSSLITNGTTVYKWTNDNKDIGLAESGEGIIKSFKVLNTDTIPKVATISVTPWYTYGGVTNSGATYKFTITVNPGLIITTQPQSSNVCRNGVITPLKVAYEYGVGNPSYQWYLNTINSNIGGTKIQGATTDTYTLQSTTAGTNYYYCVITMSRGVCNGIASDVATVSISDAPVITVHPTRLQNICVGGTIDNPLKVEYNGGSGNPTYQWYYNTSDSKIGATPVNGATNVTFTPSAFTQIGSFFYFVEISMSGNGCGSVFSDIAEIKVVADPVVVTQPLSNQTICKGTAVSDLTVTATGGLGKFLYQWYVNSVNDNSTGDPIDGAINDTFTPSSNQVGTLYYYCDITQDLGLNCGVTSSTAKVTINDVPVITKDPLSKSFCLGEKTDSLSVLYSNGVGLPTYQWFSNSIDSNTGGTIIPGATERVYYPIVDAIGKTYYYCEISFQTGGIPKIVSKTASITVNPVAVIKTHSVQICSGTSFLVIPTSQNGDIVPDNTNYTWSVPTQNPLNSVSGASSQSIPVSEISQKLNNLTDNIATVTYVVTPITGTCIGESFNVEVKVSPVIKPHEILQNVSCFGANNGFIHTTISGGLPNNNTQFYTVLWSGPNGFSSTDSDINDLLPGDYTISITDASGCSFSDTYTITEPNVLEIKTDIKKDIDCFSNKNGRIDLTVSGGTLPYTFNWTKDGLPFATTKNLSNIEPGSYSLNVKDANGCEINSITYEIKEPEALKINLDDQQNNLCFGDSIGSISISVTGGTPFDINSGKSEYTYLWTGQNGFQSNLKDLVKLPAGIYNLTVTDANGCIQTSSVEITQPVELKVNVRTKPMTCFSANDAAIFLDITGGLKPYQTVWSNMGKGTFQENLGSGDYTINVTDSNNCQKIVRVNIAEANFSIHPVIKNVSCFGAHDGSINLNVTGGINPISLVWDDNPNAGSQRNQLAPGFYSVTAHDAAPCNIRETFMISEPQQINIQAKITNAFDCDNPNSGSIKLTVTGGTKPYLYQWSNGSKTQDLSNLSSGKYSLIVTDSSGCTQTAQYEIFRQAPLSVSLDVQNLLVFESQKLTKRFTANVSGGFAPYTLHWSDGIVSGINNETIEINKNTIIQLHVTDSLGCVLDYSFPVIIPVSEIVATTINCSKSEFIFSFTSETLDDKDFNYNWYFGDGETSTERIPVHRFAHEGQFPVHLVISNGVSTANFEKTVIINMVSRLSLDQEPKLCLNDSLEIQVKGAYTYFWNDGTVGDKYMLKKAGNYSVIGTNQVGCKDTLRFTATTYDLFNYTVMTQNEDKVAEDVEIEFWSENIPYSAYHWDFNDNSYASGIRVSHNFKTNQLGYYDVKLDVVNPNGCHETATKRIWIKTPVELPNTFTPNGDGINEVFLKGWQIKLYNRNGILLYEGNDGWDGLYKGQTVSAGVYYYQIFYQTQTGVKTESGYVRVIR